MNVIKIDGTNKKYIFEDYEEVDFKDKRRYLEKKYGINKSDSTKKPKKRRRNTE